MMSEVVQFPMPGIKAKYLKSTIFKFYLKLCVDTGPVTAAQAEGRSRVQVLSLAQVSAPLPPHTVVDVESLDKNTDNC